MSPTEFHNKPFNEGTLTKLELFELYTREWIPVFLSQTSPKFKEVHIFDFFAGPGTDANGVFGSPLRILSELRKSIALPGWNTVKVSVHLFDDDAESIRRLSANIDSHGLRIPNVALKVQALPFAKAFKQCRDQLSANFGAKLVFIDQFGVDHVSDEVFQNLLRFSTCDFIFFISSSVLHRFRNHPAIKQKIQRPDDYYHVHKEVSKYYRNLIPRQFKHTLVPFSIKKGANIYGIIFCSANLRGVEKFLRVAWTKDSLSGEADFDINRDNIDPNQPVLPMKELQPTKITAFETELERCLRSGLFTTELDVLRLCFEHGVRAKHAEPVLAELKRTGVIEADFRVPQVKRDGGPRAIRLLKFF